MYHCAKLCFHAAGSLAKLYCNAVRSMRPGCASAIILGYGTVCCAGAALQPRRRPYSEAGYAQPLLASSTQTRWREAARPFSKIAASERTRTRAHRVAPEQHALPRLTSPSRLPKISLQSLSWLCGGLPNVEGDLRLSTYSARDIACRNRRPSVVPSSLRAPS